MSSEIVTNHGGNVWQAVHCYMGDCSSVPHPQRNGREAIRGSYFLPLFLYSEFFWRHFSSTLGTSEPISGQRWHCILEFWVVTKVKSCVCFFFFFKGQGSP